MWRQLLRPVIPLRCSSYRLLGYPVQNLLHQQVRTTFILKRRWAPGLVKKWREPSTKRLRARHFVYDLVEDTDTRKKKELEVILTDFVTGIGNRGDRIIMKQDTAYHKLLLPGFAVYATPENVQKFSHLKDDEHKPKYSSPFVEKTISILQNMNVMVLMNRDIPWTVEPWHIRLSFRRAGVHIPEDAISMPEEPICGPNMEIENKFFEVTVTINNTEKVPVKCVIHHWSTYVSDKLPPAEDMAEKPRMRVFPVAESERGFNANSDITTGT